MSIVTIFVKKKEANIFFKYSRYFMSPYIFVNFFEHFPEVCKLDTET